MSLYYLTKSVSTIASTLGLVTISSFCFANSVNAFGVTFQNTDFDDDTNGSGTLANWSGYGDVNTTGNISYTGASPGTVSPLSGANQAIITTGYVDGTYSGTARDDDGSFEFNQSGTNPLDADTDSDINDLQTQLGFGTNAFSIPRVNNTISNLGARTSKEGSGMSQTFNVTLDGTEEGFNVSFNWAYLSNDGDSIDGGGESDFGFWSLGQVDGSNYTTLFSNTQSPTDEISVLDSSGGSIVAPTGNDVYGQGVNYTQNSYTVDTTGLGAGTYTYRLGFGVIDVDGLEGTSALLVDDIAIEEVPWEFSPSTGIGLVLGLIGVSKLRRKLKK